MRITSGPAFPFIQPAVRTRGFGSSVSQLVSQRPVSRRSQLERLRQQLLSQGLRGADTAYIQRSSLAKLPKNVLVNNGMNVISSAASALKSSLKASLAPYLERLKAQDALYQKALQQRADEETLARLEQEMQATASVIQEITDELTKIYDGFVNAVSRIYTGLTGGEFARVLADRLEKLESGFSEKEKLLDFSSKGLGIDNLGFWYDDVMGKLHHAFDVLTIYEGLAVEQNHGFQPLIQSMGFEWVSGVYQFGVHRTPPTFHTWA